MKRLFTWLLGFVSNNESASSKRLVGIICAGFLCWALVQGKEHQPSDALVYSIAALSAAALGLTSFEKMIKKDDNETK